jgi:16S rRNA uridine-516 pseudouridylate synthase and related pseudouridylate synthases
MSKQMRLNKYLGDTGICTRREADELIEQGRIIVNGKVAHVGFVIDPYSDTIRYDGEIVSPDKLEDNADRKISGWRAEKKAAKQAKLAEAAANPKSKTLRSGRKKNVHESTKLTDKELAARRSSRSKREQATKNSASAKNTPDKNGRLVTKGASMRMEDAIKSESIISSVKNLKKKPIVNPKSAALRGKSTAKQKSRIPSKGRR